MWNEYPLLCIHVHVCQTPPVANTYVVSQATKELSAGHADVKRMYLEKVQTYEPFEPRLLDPKVLLIFETGSGR